MNGRSPATLHMASSMIRKSQTKVLVAVQSILLLSAAAGFAILMAAPANADPENARSTLELLLSALAPDGAIEVATYIALVFAALAVWQQGRARMTVDDDGIHARMPVWLGMPGLRQTGGTWHVPWSDIRLVGLESPGWIGQTGQGLRLFRLRLSTSNGDVLVNPYVWYDPDGPDHRVSLFEILGRAKDNPSRIRSTPLVRQLEARGFEIDDGQAAEKQASASFDLARHKGLAFQLVALFALAGYFAIDHFFLTPYLPLEPIPKAHFLPIAAGAFLVIVLTGRGAPPTERIAVGALTLAAVIAAVHPATLRFNAIDADRFTAGYEAVEIGRFSAHELDLPDIDLTSHRATEYWERYPPGRRHEFTIVRGRGGFRQLHLTPLNRKIRAWYAGDD